MRPGSSRPRPGGRRLAALAAALLVALAPGARADGLDDIVKRGELRVAIAEQPPWMLRDAAGEPIGYDVDLTRRLAGDLGVAVRYVVVPFAELLPTLAKGKADVAAGGLSITPARALEAAFSAPTMHSRIELVTRRERLDEHDSLAAFDDPAKQVVATADTTTAMVAAASLPRAALRTTPTEPEAMKLLVDGQVDAALLATPWPERLLAEQPDRFGTFGEPLLRTAEALAVRPGEQRFLRFLDNWIATLEAAGFLERSRSYWFESEDWRARVAQPEVEEPAAAP